MLVHSVLAFLLFVRSNVLSLPDELDENCTKANNTVLGPVSELHVMSGYAAPDGYKRAVTLFNGQLPGPLIQANKGDEFHVEVFNELTNKDLPTETSVHFHGIFQHGSNWADGAAFVTQCPLRQDERFVQKFNTSGQTGTHWYHSHFPSQLCEGLRGPLVIYDPEDPLAGLYDVDDESTVITLADWYHPLSVPGKFFGFPNSTLINGQGRYPGGPPASLSVVNVKKGLRYRFRVIAMSCEAAFNFTIDGHRMTIIEADGVEVYPVDVDSLQILSGQRYSVVVTADQPVGNYWVRALTNLPNATFEGGQNLAILRYDGAPEEDPTSTPGPYELAFDETELHPLINPGAPGMPEIGEADVNLVLALGFNLAAGEFTLGNASFVPPTVPVLLQILSGVKHATQLMPQGSVYVLPPNKVVEISFPGPNMAPGVPHPIHLHGNTFDVVRSAGSTTNFVNPVRRDTVSSGSSPADNVTIRFRTDNPGPWFLHCHLEYHLQHGFAAVMAVAPDEIVYQEAPVVPEDWKNLC